MSRTYWVCFLFTGLAIAGCGSDSGSPPDASTPYDAGSNTKNDAAPMADGPMADAAMADAPMADAPITDAAPVMDLAALTDVHLPDAPIALDAATVDVAIDTVGGADLQTPLDSAHVDASAVDVAGLEGGGG